ncbi:MAG: hypothetical protein EXQ58_07480 [Acidobacteria bacterium]|nr:hypothetical protein [Acidobacteriota bacterium]
MEQALHGAPQGFLVVVQAGRVLRSACRPSLEGGSQQWLDDFVAENQQSCQNLESLWKRLVALLAAPALNPLFASELLQVVGRLVSPVIGGRWSAEVLHLTGQFDGGEACRIGR